LARCAFIGLAALLAGCATPVFHDAPTTVPTPLDVAATPERYHDADVVWGGKILGVRNLAETTEVELVAYPLDDSQRPDQNAPTQGRFIVSLPGFAEPLDYPAGRFLTLRGRVGSMRTRRIEDRDLVMPLVTDATLHLWPVNFPYERPRVQFGIGVGVGLH